MAMYPFTGLQTILLGGLLATANAAEIDSERMQRDLRVMEGVLRDLHGAPAIGEHFVPPGGLRARGLYIEGYGALFIAEGPLPGAEPVKRIVQVEIDDQGQERVSTTTQGREGGAKTTGDSHEETRIMLGEFMSSYAGSIGQLKDNERVTVLYQPSHQYLFAGAVNVDVDVDFTMDLVREAKIEQAKAAGDLNATVADIDSLKIALPRAAQQRVHVVIDTLNNDGRRTPGHAFKVASPHPVAALAYRPPRQPSLLSASAKKGDIDAHRRGKIDDATFSKRIEFAQRERDDNKKISIMSGIIDQVVGDGSPQFESKTLGVYQPGLGALFSLSIPTHVRHFHARSGAAQQGEDPLITQLKKQLADAIADYGATLRDVKTKERVLIEVRLGGESFGARKAQRLLMQVEKADIDAYSAGKITREKLRQKIEWKVS